MGGDRSLDVAVLVTAAVASGALSLALGQDVNFDLRQYHYYVGYAFLDGRLDRDVAPSGLGTFLNPLIHVLHYLGISHLSPRRFGFLLGAVHGLNAFLVFKIARAVLPRGERGATWLALAAGALAMLGANALGLLGTTFGDNLTSIPALLALLVLLGSPPSLRRILLAGLLGGMATGLKLTMGVYEVGLAAAVVVLAGRRRSAFRIPGAFALGSVLGFLATSGYWSLMLWERFGNPVFPFANRLFQSPFFSTEPLRDVRFLARGWGGILMFPYDMATGATDRLLEVPFRETRFLAVLLAALAWLLSRLPSRRDRAVTLGSGAELLLVYWLAACAAWSVGLHYYRYLALAEALAPVAVFVLLGATFPRVAGVVSPAVALAVALSTSAAAYDRRPWPENWFDVRVPPVGREPNAIVLIDGTPMGFTIPFFPREDRFFGVFGQTPGLEPRMRAELAGHAGPLLRLGWSREPAVPLERFGLRQTDDCEVVRTGGVGRFQLCRLARP